MQLFNKENWIVHYPDLNRKAQSRPSSPVGLRRSYSSQAGGSLSDQANGSSSSSSNHQPVNHPGMHRSITTLVEGRSGSASAPNSPARKPSRSNTTPLNDVSEEPSTVGQSVDEEEDGELSVLRLDLKLGAATRNPHELVNTLEKSSVAQLLDGRMGQALRHLDSLHSRISDTQSKVLITGDLNAGKSTFVNALLRRELMPTDQQPCTTVFCEVLDASELNNGKEEVHMLKEGIKYNVEDSETFTVYSLDDIDTIVSEAEDVSPEDAPMLKCYCEDKRSAKESLLRNGVVDIALIDAPGLNRDSLKTTALFARQEEIDVVVFCLSAENHFTLSAKEFLWNASNDKAYIFIVVNKFEQIKNKEKCKRLVLEQIKQLSPRTYEDAKDLVHFVDSDSVLGHSDLSSGLETPTDEKVQGTSLEDSQSSSEQAFAKLEASLRDFVLLKRSKSKLLPAQTYLLRLLFDINFLSRTNASAAAAELEEAREALELARPALEKCKANHSKLEGLIEAEEDGVVSSVSIEAQKAFDDAVDLIGKGESAVSKVSLPEYPGLFEALNYAAMVRAALLESIEAATSDVEDAARITTTEAVERIRSLGDKYLPEDVNEGNKRVFLPDAMFSKRRTRGHGLSGLGLSQDSLDARPSDIFDFMHHWNVVIGKENKKYNKEGKEIDEEDESSLVNRLSLTAGALTLVGGKTLGVRSAIESLTSVMDLVGNKTARKWAAPVIGVVTVGLVIYFITDLPNSIPRNVGRSLKKDLVSGRNNVSTSSIILSISNSNDEKSSTSIENVSFSIENSNRISRETRKVLRLASWDLQERFRVALASRRAEVEKNENKEKKANKANDFFVETGMKVQEVKEKLEGKNGVEC